MKRILAVFLTVVLLLCGTTATAMALSKEGEIPHHPPYLQLTELGRINATPFEVGTGGFMWAWEESDDLMGSIIADALPPTHHYILETEPLVIPNYSGRKSAWYRFQWNPEPDIVTLLEYPMTAVDHYEVEPLSEKTLKKPYHARLHKDRIYVVSASWGTSIVSATWSEAQKAKCYGGGQFVFRTE